jgi:hypothetical protein
MKLHLLKSLAAVLVIGTSAARADIIVFSTRIVADTDALRFSDSSLVHTGSLVQGNFLSAGLGYVMNFSSTSGNGLIAGLESVGVPTQIQGLAGNDPLAALSFSLSQPNQTFTKAVFDVNAGSSNSLFLTVLEPDGSITASSFGIGGLSSFTIEAVNGQSIRSISLTQTSIDDLRGMRFGGFAGGVGSSVPDSGATVAMLGLAFAGLVGFRRRLRV